LAQQPSRLVAAAVGGAAHVAKNMNVRVLVVGAGGRMGKAVCEAVLDDSSVELVAAVDPAHAGASVGNALGRDDTGLEMLAGLDDVAVAVDVAVDFTALEAARANLDWCAANSVHAVVGTTGFDADDLARLTALFTQSNLLIAPNFAIGAVLMMRFAELAAPFFEAAEIVELHHEHKVDAPSGTALRTAERLAEASGDWLGDPTEFEPVIGARGAEGPAGIRIHSVRLRGLVAHQEVLLGTTGQSLTIRHDSYDRSSFMPGVLHACRVISEHPGVTIGLDTYLGI